MLRFLADENVRGPVISGILRRQPDLDLIRAVDVHLGNTSDETILEWAAQNERILLTRDNATMIGFIRDRVSKGLHMPGAIVLRERATHRQQIESVIMVALASESFEWMNRIEFLPWQQTTS